MASRKPMKGILQNFLGTYTSRYSDYNGYCLFGMFVSDLDELKINLLTTENIAGESKPMAIARQLAATKFSEQVNKVGLAISQVREAHLTIKKLAALKKGVVNERVTTGHEVQFLAMAVLDNGKTFESKTVEFIAPHNPEVERQSTRALTPK
jgi:hypothetical protein